jgi:hypothetical protein
MKYLDKLNREQLIMILTALTVAVGITASYSISGYYLAQMALFLSGSFSSLLIRATSKGEQL